MSDNTYVMVRVLKFIGAVMVCIAAGLIGVPFNLNALDGWYADLNKPFFNPPNWVFEPVWTILYVLMGTSLFLITQKGLKTKKVRDALYLFLIQLILNAAWSPIFFGLKNPLMGLVVIVALFITIDKTIKAFVKVDITAARLLYPYFVWVGFATMLNLSIVILNR